MGVLRSLFTGRPDPVLEAAKAGPDFTVMPDSGVLYGTPTLDDYIYRTGRITREEALRVPAVKRARDLICGAIGQFPLRFLDPNGKPAVNFTPNLFQQPEAGVAPSVTWTRAIEDMLLDERAFLRVVSTGWHGRPIEVHRLESDTVSVQPKYVQYREGSALVWPDVPGLIRIDSPNPGILSSPAVRACIALERATLKFVDGAPPLDYFTPADGIDPGDSDEIREILDDWQTARQTRSTGYVPAALNYNVAGWEPEKLQLATVREFAITEVARLTGLDAEDLSVSTTSRTYFNAQDRRRVRIEDVLGPYMTAVEGRLSMGDVSPYGYTAAFDTSNYLRLDDLSAAQTDSVLIAAKVLRPEEARAKRGLDPSTAPSEPVDSEQLTAALVASAALETGARS